MPQSKFPGIRMRVAGKLIGVAPFARSDDEPAALEELNSHGRIRIDQKVPHVEASGTENGSFQVVRNVAAPENHPGGSLRGVKDFCIEETSLMDDHRRLLAFGCSFLLNPGRRPHLDHAAL